MILLQTLVVHTDSSTFQLYLIAQYIKVGCTEPEEFWSPLWRLAFESWLPTWQPAVQAFSAGVQMFLPQKRHVETPEERKEWGESKGAGVRVGTLLLPPFPSFALQHLPLKDYYSYSPQSSSHNSKMAATTIRT